MVDPFIIEADEFGWVRVFTVDIDAADLTKINTDRLDTQPKAAAIGDMLGLDWVDPMHAELFDLADLEGLGLAGYLAQGAGIPQDAIKAEEETLGAIFGVVLIVYTKAFEGEAVTLDPAPNVNFACHFEQERADIAFRSLPKADRKAEQSPPAPAPVSPHLRLIQAIVALPLIVLFLGLLIWLIFR